MYWVGLITCNTILLTSVAASGSLGALFVHHRRREERKVTDKAPYGFLPGPLGGTASSK